MTSSSDHFQGKSVVDHLREARLKGATASAEIHGVEMPGHLAAGADSAKETAAALILLWILLRFSQLTPGNELLFLSFFSCGWLLWKAARSAFLGWSRLERLHRLIEEERWEIEHHRQQEREELTAMYAAKGFSGKLLEEVIDVLMADDNRLLKVMLEEELGLSLAIYEHPLKQSFGAAIGVACSAALCLFGFWLAPPYGIAAGALCIAVTAALAAKLERNRAITAVIWSLALAMLIWGVAYFTTQMIFASCR